MDPASSPYASVVARLAGDPTAPLVTDVDLASGDRVELSVGSVVNGAAKAAHLVGGLATELARPPRIAVRLPLHWQAVTFALGAWAAGGVLLAGDGGDVDAVVLGPDEALDPPALTDSVDVVWASRLHPFGLPFAEPPAFPVEDLTVALRQQPDAPPPDRSRPGSPALVIDGREASVASVLARAAELASEDEDERLLSALPWSTLDGWVAGVALPSSGQRSVVLVRGVEAADGTALARLCASENVTATAGIDVPGLPRIC